MNILHNILRDRGGSETPQKCMQLHGERDRRISFILSTLQAINLCEVLLKRVFPNASNWRVMGVGTEEKVLLLSIKEIRITRLVMLLVFFTAQVNSSLFSTERL